MSGRPERVQINYGHPLARGLVFAGLGELPNSTYYHDSSLYSNHGTLTNMEPASDWAWSGELRRFGTLHDGSDEYVTGTTGCNFLGDFTAAVWVLGQSSGANAMTIMGNYQAVPGGGWMFGPDNAGTMYYWVRNGATNYFDTTAGHVSTAYTHYAMQFIAGVGIFLYRNGRLVDSKNSHASRSYRKFY